MHDVLELRRNAEEMLGVPKKLHEYQWEGVAFLYRSRAALLADEMGLGKTVQASVALALLLNTRNELNRALIVTPASLTINWMTEFATWTPSLTVRRVQGSSRDREAFYLLPIPVLISSYEQIRQDGLDRIPSDSFDVVILDEAQRIKNSYSATSLACRVLPRKYSWALSATPLENDPNDVASILGFLDPSIRVLPSGTRLSQQLETIMLRRRKAEVRGELPPVIVQDLKLELAPSQRVRYDQLWTNRRDHAAASAQDAGAVLLALVMRLKIVCNRDAETEASAKFDALCEICDEAGQGGRLLVFSQFVETLKWLSDKIDLPTDLITGEMPGHQRHASIERFNTEPTPRVLLVSLRAGGVGLNIGEATHVVLFDRWWNPAVEMQAIYRAHRFDRKEPLHVVRFMIIDTIEERIAAILDHKENLFEDVVESAETTVQGFTVQELMRILELSGGEVLTHQSSTGGI